MKKFCCLLSCMYEKDTSIIERSNIRFPAVIVNQSDTDEKKMLENNIIWINSTERGLSNSRNMAINNNDADICLIADNDEIFDDDCEEKILKAYDELPDADIIAFRLYGKPTKLKNKIYKLSRWELFRVCSCQITFNRRAIIKSGVKFDNKLGAGTGNGAGEENKFLLDCFAKNIKIYHYPVEIAGFIENESTWFTGFDEDFFYKQGMVIRYTLGLLGSVVYASYYLIAKYNTYKSTISFRTAFVEFFKGVFENKLK